MLLPNDALLSCPIWSELTTILSMFVGHKDDTFDRTLMEHVCAFASSGLERKMEMTMMRMVVVVVVSVAKGRGERGWIMA